MFQRPNTAPEKYVQLALLQRRGSWLPKRDVVELARDLGDADGYSPDRDACARYLDELVASGEVDERTVYADTGLLVRLP